MLRNYGIENRNFVAIQRPKAVDILTAHENGVLPTIREHSEHLSLRSLPHIITDLV